MGGDPVPAGHILVRHGKLSLMVPRSIFRGGDAEPDGPGMREFLGRTRSRYPWLTENALKLIARNAREEMRRVLWEEKRGAAAGRELAAESLDAAIRYLERHLEADPGDADAWFALGDSLCRAGRQEEGYEAFRRGRRLSGI